MNIGDELIVLGLIILLQRHNPHSLFHVSTWKKSFIQSFHHYFASLIRLDTLVYLQEIPHGFRSGLRFLRLWWRDFVHYLQCDTFILWGWELFTSETPGSYLYRWWSLLPYWIRKICFFPTKLYIMGGIQKSTHWYNNLILTTILHSSSGAFLRDHESVTVVRSLLSDQKHHTIKRFMDTSYFVVNAATISSLLPHWNSFDAYSKYIIINSNPLSKQWTNKLKTIIDTYTSQWYEIYFLPGFYTTNSSQDDMSVYYMLVKQWYKLRLLDWRVRDLFLPIFLHAEQVYCSRLHIYLIARFLNIRVQPYQYQQKLIKMQSILNSLSQKKLRSYNW